MNAPKWLEKTLADALNRCCEEWEYPANGDPEQRPIARPGAIARVAIRELEAMGVFFGSAPQ